MPAWRRSVLNRSGIGFVCVRKPKRYTAVGLEGTAEALSMRVDAAQLAREPLTKGTGKGYSPWTIAVPSSASEDLAPPRRGCVGGGRRSRSDERHNPRGLVVNRLFRGGRERAVVARRPFIRPLKRPPSTGGRWVSWRALQPNCPRSRASLSPPVVCLFRPDRRLLLTCSGPVNSPVPRPMRPTTVGL